MSKNSELNINSKTVVSNMFWRFMERIGAQGVSFIVSIVLARLLDPSVYGTIALITIFTSILQVFIDSGFGNALIQKKNADDLDFSTVFYFNVLVCGALYIVMFLASPYIAEFYKMPELTPVVRVLSLTLVISGIKNIQQAYVSRHLLFKKFFYATLGGTVGAAVVGVWMAYRGYGVWALVAQNLLNATVDTLILWMTVKWRPQMKFSFIRLKELFEYGWKLLVSSLLDVVYKDLRSLIIGRLYSSSDLAYYNRGQQFPNLIVTNVNASINSVLLPTMAAEQDDRLRVRSITRRAIKTSTYIMMPLMMGLAVCAEPLIRIVLTAKWLPCVFFMRIYCFSFAFFPIHTANLNAIKAMGRSDLFLKLEVFKKIIGLIALAATMFISVEAMAVSMLFTSILSQVINSWPNRKLLEYRYIDQVMDMLPQIGLTCLMGGIVYSITYLRMTDIITLLLQAISGVIIYVLGSKIFKIDSYKYLIGVLKSYLRKTKQ